MRSVPGVTITLNVNGKDALSLATDADGRAWFGPGWGDGAAIKITMTPTAQTGDGTPYHYWNHVFSPDYVSTGPNTFTFTNNQEFRENFIPQDYGSAAFASDTFLDGGEGFYFGIQPKDHLAFIAQPSGNVLNGSQFDVQVRVDDSDNHPDSSFNGNITLQLANDPNGNTKLRGTLTVPVQDGVADFSDLTLNHAGQGYTLMATASGAESTTSGPIDINDQLVATTQPPVRVYPNQHFDIKVSAEDAAGQADSDFNGSETIAVANNAGNSTLSGTATVNAINGLADFPGLSLDRAGSNYTLQATGTQLYAGTTNPFDVTAAKISFYVGPYEGVGINPYTETGHAFVQLYTTTGPQADDPTLGGGLYPDGRNFFNAPGQIVGGFLHAWDWRITFPLTAEQFDAAQNFIDNQTANPPDYQLLSNNNCAGWVQQVAGSVSIFLPVVNNKLGIPDPYAFEQSLSQIGDGNTFAGGSVQFNSAGTLPNNTPDPPLPYPDQGSYDGIAAAALQDPSSLAQGLGLAFQQQAQSAVDIGAGQSLAVNLANVDIDNAIVLFDFGDGTVVEQALSDSHSYQTSGTWQARAIVVNSGAVAVFPFQVNVDTVSGGGTVSIQVPDPPPNQPPPDRTPPVFIDPIPTTPAFGSLNAPIITYGAASTTITGSLISKVIGENVPAGETVAVTLHGVTQNATLDSNQDFSTTFATGSLAASGSPYTISFDYGGDPTFKAITGTSTLTVQPVMRLGVTAGPNNTVWFTDTTSNQVAMLNTTTSTLGTPIAVTAEPEGIVYVPGGNLFFTECDPTTQTGYIGQINPNTGQFLGSVQTPTKDSDPVGITYDPRNGNVYFVEKAAGKIGSFNPSDPSSMQENALPNASLAAPSGIVYDPIDRDLWFTEEGAHQIGSYDPNTNTFNSTPFTLPNGTLPSAITLGPDGNLWFTESGVGLINMFSPSKGTFAANGPYALPASSGNAGAAIQGITAGPDGDIWFTAQGVGQIGRFNPSAIVTSPAPPNEISVFDTLNSSSPPYAIAAGPDGNLWYTETGAHGSIDVAYDTQLQVSTPSNVTTSIPFSLRVTVVYDTGLVDTNFNGNITASVASGPGPLTSPFGLTTVPANNGVAIFFNPAVPPGPLNPGGGIGDLTLNVPGNYVLQAAVSVPSGRSPSVTTSPFSVTTTGGRGASNVPTITGESVVLTFLRHNKRGKPIGKPVVSFVFQYSTAMNSSTAGNPSNYQVDWISTKRVKKKGVVTVLHRVAVRSATYSSANHAVTVTTSAGKTTFAKGGQITVIAAPPNGVTDGSGVALDGNNKRVAGDNGLFKILASAGGITR